MAPPPFIENIALLQELGILSDVPPTGPNFCRKTLIYGFNGSGKSTLARALRCLEAGQAHPALPAQSKFTFALSDGTHVGSETLASLVNKIAVFNVDFIEDNLLWKEGRANPVYYLGADQARRAELLQRLRTRLPFRATTSETDQRAARSAERAFSELKTSAARIIATELNLGRSYQAPNLVEDIAALGPGPILSAADVAAKKAVYIRPAPKPRVPQPLAAIPNPDKLISKIELYTKRTIGGLIDEFREHQTMLTWIREGHDYHADHELSTCLFCGNELSPSRLEILRASLSTGFTSLIDEGVTLQAGIVSAKTELQNILTGLPEKGDLMETLVDDYQRLSLLFKQDIADLNALFTELTFFVSKKQRQPDLVDEETLATLRKRVMDAFASAQESRTSVDALLSQHNLAHDEFSTVQSDAFRELKSHFLRVAKEDYERSKDAAATSEAKAQRTQKLHQKLVGCIGALEQRIRSHAVALGRINDLLAAYLGHSELKLVTADSGYKMERKGRPATGPLSEGEKTAVALCYFLSKLEENGRKIADLIVVIDDPISSLDSRALNYAVGLIRGALQTCAQLIILTHNLHFMNEVKKWIKHEARANPPTAALCFLETTVDTQSLARRSRLIALPTLLRDYDSEYHYLFSLVHKHVQENGATQIAYLLPNVMRKVLEVFLAFKEPGNAPLAAKLNSQQVKGCGLDEASLRALNRLADLESHADSLDDLTTFSSMSIEETSRSA